MRNIKLVTMIKKNKFVRMYSRDIVAYTIVELAMLRTVISRFWTQGFLAKEPIPFLTLSIKCLYKSYDVCHVNPILLWPIFPDYLFF